MMKRFLSLSLMVLIIISLILSGCAKKEEAGLDVDTKEALQTIMDNAKAAVGEDAFIPFTLDMEVTADNCDGYLGLTSDQFKQYVMESYTLIAAINAQAFDLALVKCKDYASAKEIKKLIAEGFDPANRICAVSEVAFVVDSGRFVLLGGVAVNTAESFQKAFSDYFEEKTGDVNTFFERSGEAPAVGGGGMDISIN
ncbi:MAG: hypothetical protein FWF15_07895 [Oscillospiraceae bacterium]|nr:hypothetical protein [Oscillospiraceae bacterium]